MNKVSKEVSAGEKKRKASTYSQRPKFPGVFILEKKKYGSYTNKTNMEAETHSAEPESLQAPHVPGPTPCTPQPRERFLEPTPQIEDDVVPQTQDVAEGVGGANVCCILCATTTPSVPTMGVMQINAQGSEIGDSTKDNNAEGYTIRNWCKQHKKVGEVSQCKLEPVEYQVLLLVLMNLFGVLWRCVGVRIYEKYCERVMAVHPHGKHFKKQMKKLKQMAVVEFVEQVVTSAYAVGIPCVPSSVLRMIWSEIMKVFWEPAVVGFCTCKGSDV